MYLPEIIEKLVMAQNNFDSTAYADCFADNAIVFDEGKNHQGKEAIKTWNELTNAEYSTTLEPVDFQQNGDKSVLIVKVSGTFDGSPLLFDYHFEIQNERITSLKITLH